MKSTNWNVTRPEYYWSDLASRNPAKRKFYQARSAFYAAKRIKARKRYLGILSGRVKP